MSTSLEGQVALVTGGSRGIGAAIAKTLAERGADVALSYSSSRNAADKVVAEIEALGRRAAAFQADAADRHSPLRLVDAVMERFGRLDILVNNAGTFVVAPLTELSDEDFDRLFNINVRGVFLTSRAAAKAMADGGRIINIGSVNGDKSFVPGLSAYGASKAAVQGLTRGWARDLAERRITVNAVQPGPIDTDMNPADGEFADVLRGFVALGRYGKAQEVADTVAFLASPAASYVSGAEIDVSGGMGI